MKYVCLLRGINVGGNNSVPMLELKKTFESMGFSDVTTYLNSGNVIFASDVTPDARDIQKWLQKVFSLDIPVLIFSADQIIRIAEAIPDGWHNDAMQKTDVVYLFSDLDNANFPMKIGYNADIETAVYVPGAVLWNVSRKNQSRSSLLKMVGTDLYLRVTIRNCNTARKLAELVR